VSETIDVQALIDDQTFGPFAIRVLILGLMVLIADGYDVQVLAFAAPQLQDAWHVKSAAFAPAFSASLLGALVGSPILGAIGDKVGRKIAVIASCIIYGLLSLACVLAPDLKTLVILRFLTGLGMGGVVPNTIAITAELWPRRARAVIASLIAVGITIGGTLPGLLAAQMGPHGDWRLFFVVGGIAPFVIAAIVALALPESVVFLAQRGGSPARIARLVRAIAPGAGASDQTRYVVDAPPEEARAGFAELFRGRLALVTPLLWLMAAATLLTIYLLTNWLPLQLSHAGFSKASAALTNSLFQAGGACGVILASLLLARIGPYLVAALFLCTFLALAAVAGLDLPNSQLPWAMAVCGFLLIGAQGAINGTSGLAYPTGVRAKGVGMVLGVGRVGSVIGPMLGGAMVAAGGVTAHDLFMAPLAPLALGTLAAFIVAWRLTRRTAPA
jgi:AAHS family 4-hydroxybenzoate transporter-like MFS transporter